MGCERLDLKTDSQPILGIFLDIVIHFQGGSVFFRKCLPFLTTTVSFKLIFVKGLYKVPTKYIILIVAYVEYVVYYNTILKVFRNVRSVVYNCTGARQVFISL